ncbi:MAG: hypothetical protein ABI183_01335, partial [Polyangiaceae bacterium]
MLRKRIVLGLAFGLTTIALTTDGCGGDVATSPPPDAGADVREPIRDAQGPLVDADCCGPNHWEETCFDPSTILTFTTAPLPPTANQGKCASDALLTQFFDACVANAGDAGVGDGGEMCADYIQTNPDCALCLGGDSAPDAGTPRPSSWPAILQIDSAGHVVPNVAACLAAISNGTDTCKSNYANDDLCLESGCEACAATDFSTCATTQTTDPTSSCLTANPLDSACQAALNAVPQTDADSKCAASTTINTQADFQN